MSAATKFPVNIPVGYNITSAFLAVLQDQNGNNALIPISPSGAIEVTSSYGFSPVSLSSASITRPADTTAYSANDSLSNSTSAPTPLSFTGIFPNSGNDGYIVAARATVQGAAFAGALRLHLYTSSVTAVNDNSPFTLLFANRAIKIGYIDFLGFQYGGTGSDCSESYGVFSTGSYLPAVLATGTTIYGLVEVRTAFTPTSAQQFYFELKTQLS